MSPFKRLSKRLVRRLQEWTSALDGPDGPSEQPQQPGQSRTLCMSAYRLGSQVGSSVINLKMNSLSFSLLFILSALSHARHNGASVGASCLVGRDVAATIVTVTTTTTLTSCSASFATIPSISSPPHTSSAQALSITGPTSQAERTQALTFIRGPESPTNVDDVMQVGNDWVLPDGQRFRNRKVYTFDGASLPDGLEASAYLVQDTTYSNTANIPYNHQFNPSNVQLSDGFLNLTVPGGQHPVSPTRNNANGTPISAAEVVTTECNMKYASVRTNAILSNVPGTCQAIFFYLDDQNEADIELVSDPRSGANRGSLNPPSLWYCNQANVLGNGPTNDNVDFPSGVNPFNEVHEYRIDWRPDRTEFFLDGVKQTALTSNSPKAAGRWIWNNWANGDPGK